MTIEMLLNVLLSGLGFFVVYILNDLTKSVKGATEEIAKLNVKIGIIITKHEVQEKDIDSIKINQDIMRDRIHTLGNAVGRLCTEMDLESNEDFGWAKKRNK